MCRYFTTTVIVLLLASACLADDYFVCKGIRVIDGDTLAVTEYDLPYNVTLRNVRVRVLGYDAWEVSGEERPNGEAASKDVAALVAQGTVYAIPSRHERHRDNFGRLLARIVVRLPDDKLIDLRQYMQERGHCKPKKP